MKKVIAFMLSLMFVLSLIPATSLFASAASNDGKWEKAITYTYSAGMVTVVKTEITIYIKHTKVFLGYKSRIKLETVTTETSDDGDTHTKKTYTSPEYNFLSKPTVEDLCKKDSKIKKTNIYENLEQMCTFDYILKNPINYLLSAKKSWSDLAKDTTKGIAKDIIKGRDVTVMKGTTGFDTPICKLVDTARDAINFKNDAKSSKTTAEKIGNDIMSLTKAITIIKEQLWTKYVNTGNCPTVMEYEALRDHSAACLINDISKISNGN